MAIHSLERKVVRSAREGIGSAVVPGLVRLGGRLRPRTLFRMRQAMGLLESGAWLRRQGQEFPVALPDREAVFLAALERVTASNSPLYLEFGVASGASLSWWSENLVNSNARFIGFDSFEGLPHDWQAWQGGAPKGEFAQSSVPVFGDPRVALVKGWFEDTVPVFDFPPHDRLIVVLDADLYSSTALVLERLAHVLKVDDILYFDDFPMDDKSAASDFCSKFDIRLAPLAMDSHGFHWAFSVVE